MPTSAPFTAKLRVGTRAPSSQRLVLPLGNLAQEITVSNGAAEVGAAAGNNVDAITIDQNMLDSLPVFDNDYVESVWSALKQIHDKDLLYEGHKVVPYCPRCGTALSSHEVAQGYRDVVDPSVFVRFPVLEPRTGSALQPGDELVVWTTTPWTLVSNAAVAVRASWTTARSTIASPTFAKRGVAGSSITGLLISNALSPLPN